MSSSKPNQASHTPDISYPLVSSISFPFSSPISFSLRPSQNTMLSHPALSLHAMIMSQHRVQHTLSTAYTQYSIDRVQHTLSTAYTVHSLHRVQHTPRTASSLDGLSFLHSHEYELTPECTFSFRRASLQERSPKPALHESSMVKSPRYIPTVAS
jgi:hypothetical protein